MLFKPKSKSESMDTLCQAILQLKTVEECYRFLEDLCTMDELKKLSHRIDVAVLLFHKASYEKIRILRNASTTTIGRVNKSLKYGADGYKTVFFRMKDKF
ncbi:YerC/YecD family TrpR-related protein [Mycoplasmatota bacterium WC30]